MTLEERKELEDYYGAMLAMCRSPGWKHLMDDFEASMAANLDTIKTIDELWFEKGKRQAARSLMNLEQSLLVARDSLDADNS